MSPFHGDLGHNTPKPRNSFLDRPATSLLLADEPGTGLEQIDESSALGDAVTACLVDWVIGHFNAEVFESLTGVRKAGALSASSGTKLTLKRRLKPQDTVRRARISGIPASTDTSATLDAVWALYRPEP